MKKDIYFEAANKCTMCAKECADITVVDDETRVCEECLENEFFYCEECGEYWLADVVDSVELDDGRTVCENCADELDD